MKRITLMLLMTALAIAAWAVPARPGTTIQHQAADGSTVTLQLVGDEHFHYYVNTATGEKFDITATGELQPLTEQTLEVRSRSAQERRAAANRERINRLPMMLAQAEGGPQRAIGNFGNMTGQKKGLVILVNFQDVTFKSANNQAAFDNQFNQNGYNKNGHIGSVKDYFQAQSYGNFSVDFDVVGPVTVSQSMAYYGAPSGTDNDSHPAEMVIEAIKLADSQCNVDYTKYDWGGNGYVDQVFIIYAGYNQAQGGSANTIWPHEWTLSSANYFGDGTGRQRIDGKYIDTYACTSELCGSSGSTMDGIGTACHEFSHCLGYPDLYDTNSGDCWGMDAFDLMDYGSYSGPNGHGEVPCGYSAYERWMAGWLTPTELTEPITISNMPALNDSPTAYIIYNDKTSNEYLLLENRQNNNWFKYLRTKSTGHGLLVTHVDYNSTAWSSNKVNVDTSHERFKYIAADKSYSASNMPADYFPGSSKVTSLTGTSHTSANGQWFNNNKAGNKTFTNMDLTNIAEANGLISFDFNGGTPQDDGNRYTITYWVNGEKTEWTQTEYHESTTIMTIPDEFSDWTPMGWSLTDYTGIVSFENAELANGITEGASYTPTEDITLYALYSDLEAENCTSHPVEENNTITLYVMGSEYATFTQTETIRTYTLPSAICNVPNWTFAGWSTSTIENTTTKPMLLAEGTKVRPTANVAYYAVFSSRVSQSGDGPQYRLVDEPQSGGEYILVTSNAVGSAYAIDVTKVNTTASATISGTAVTIKDNNGLMIECEDDNLLWTVTKANGKINIQNDTYYLVLNGSGFSKRTNSADLYWSTSYGLSGKSGSGSNTYYVHSNGSTINNSKTESDSNRIYLYENITGGGVTYYSSTPTVSNYTVSYNAGSGSCDEESFTQTDDLRSTSLPSATIAIEGWSFIGWATESVAMTSTRPTILTAGTSFTPMFDQTLYAVYSSKQYVGTSQTSYYCSTPSEALENVFYTISLRDGSGEGSTEWNQWTQSAGNGSYTLPAVEFEGWTFFGWSTTSLDVRTQEAPSVRTAGTEYTPSANTTFYSVFKNSKNYYISNPANYVPGGGTADPQLYIPHIAVVGEPFIAPKFNSDSVGEVYYTSSDPNVASVDSTTGKVTALREGYTIITATQAATPTHQATSASYMIKVVAE